MKKSTVVLSPRGVARVRGGHPWVRREDVAAGPDPGDAGDDVVQLVDGKRNFLATALWSAASPVAARVIARQEVDFDAAFIDARVAEALERRRALFARDEWDAYRVVHGEADRLPGLFVDRYADVAVMQSGTAAVDAREQLIAEVLMRRLNARIVVARNDGSARDFEELPRRRGVVRGAGATKVRFHDAGSLCEADVIEDGKTGSFLDQQENHARAATYVTPGMEGLDCFTYHGGFALALARAGARMIAVDESREAAARARENARLSNVDIEVLAANAFDELRSMEGRGRTFDIVVIDPPAFAKRQSALPAAERAYKELNLRGLRLLKPGGVLVTCSCSGKMTVDKFGAVIAAAARDAGRPVQLLERRGAGRDHPPLLAVPETEYLKCWILRVLE